MIIAKVGQKIAMIIMCCQRVVINKCQEGPHIYNISWITKQDWHFREFKQYLYGKFNYNCKVGNIFS